MIRVEDKLEEATNLIVEAKYIIEEVRTDKYVVKDRR